MSHKTGIQWTDRATNPLRYKDVDGNDVWACVKHSTGCAHCYSETLALRYLKGKEFTAANMRELTPYVREKELKEILSQKKTLPGSKVFVGDMTDLFGDWVPDEFIDRIFAAFALRPDVTFQVLTKRAGRMAEYCTRMTRTRLDDACGQFVDGCRFHGDLPAWPLPNVWIGTSVENQAAANERIPHLLKVPAAVRFLSCEPLLGEVILHKYLAQCECGHGHGFTGCPNTGGVAKTCHLCDCRKLRPKLGWNIIGGESGHGARPMNIEWARSLVKQCEAAEVACFVKQLGKTSFIELRDANNPYYRGVMETNHRDKKGGDMDEWPSDLRVREFPEVRT